MAVQECEPAVLLAVTGDAGKLAVCVCLAAVLFHDTVSSKPDVLGKNLMTSKTL